MLEVMPAQVVVYAFFGSFTEIGIDNEVAVGLAGYGGQIH
jgi:hypothetical protein